MEIKYRFWLENNGEVVFSNACEELLRCIEEVHSLYATTRLLKKSYRRSWEKLRASEERLGFRLVETKGPGKALHLTEEARAILEIIDQLKQNTEAFINRSWKNPQFKDNIFVIANSKKENSNKSINIPSVISDKKTGTMTE
jgi:molybdate transport system regulatory protein